MAIAAIETSQSLITWRYLWWALTAIAAMIAAILAGNLWLLNFIHVFSSLLWTGVDLFMGFVLGPILRRVDLSVRREIVRRLTPRTLFLMPTVSIISGTTGWFLAVDLGYTALAWPGYGWVAAALVLVTLMTIQGLGFLTPVNVLVCLELQKIEPDLNKIGVWMQRYFYAVALQGMMQVTIIIVMTRFRIGVGNRLKSMLLRSASPSSVMKSRRFNRLNCIRSPPARAGLQDIELAMVSQRVYDHAPGQS